MNKNKIIIFIGLIILFSNHLLVAQDTKHSILFSGSGGYSSLMTNADNFSSVGNVGFGVGAGYEFHYKKFRVQTGVEFTYLNSGLTLADFSQDKNLIDSEGDSYIGHLKFMNNQESYKLGNVNFPLMFGTQFGKMYLLAGAKVGINLLGTSVMKTTIATTATYPQFIDDFENMPNHLFTQTTEQAEYPVKLELNCSLSGEAGIYLGGGGNAVNESKAAYRLSFFFDYGLLNVHNDAIAEDLILDKTTGIPFEPVLNSFLLSANMTGTKLNTLYAGLKFTVELGLKGEKYCHCEDYKNLNRKFKKVKR